MVDYVYRGLGIRGLVAGYWLFIYGMLVSGGYGGKWGLDGFGVCIVVDSVYERLGELGGLVGVSGGYGK